MGDVDETDKLERRVVSFGVAYAIVVFTSYAIFASFSAAASAPIGASVGLLNLWLLARGLRALMANQALVAFGVFTLVKLALTALILYGMFRAGWVSPLPFVLGLGAVPVALTLAQLFTPRTQQREPHRSS